MSERTQDALDECREYIPVLEARIEKLEEALALIGRIKAPYPDLSISKYIDTIEIMNNIANKAIEE